MSNRPQDNTVIDDGSCDKIVCVLSYYINRKISNNSFERRRRDYRALEKTKIYVF